MSRKIEPNVPKHYWPQVQLQLEITDLEECDFVQYRPGDTESAPPKPEEFVVVRVHRDREWFAKALPVLERVWQRVLKGRAHGLCEILDDCVPWDAHFKKQIACEVVEEEDETAGFIPRPGDTRLVQSDICEETTV
jgi:hypothetical protein